MKWKLWHRNNLCFIWFIQDDLESVPFPNDETEFNLPDEIFESSTKPHSSASESSAVADEGMTGKDEIMIYHL